MIIEKIRLLNYKCYYGEKEFLFSNGLNFILGQNGEGKTKFFEGLEWLFDIKKGASNESHEVVSAKKLFEMAIGNVSKVEVEIVLKNLKGERTLIGKRMEFSKGENGVLNPRVVYYAREYDVERDYWKDELNDKNSFKRIRNKVIPSKLISSIFFKGEEDLTPSQGISAIDVLVTDQTDSKVFERIAKEMNYCEQKADKAVTRETSKGKKAARERENINFEIDNCSRLINETKRELNLITENINFHNSKLQKIEDLIKSSEELENIQNKLENFDDKIRHKQAIIASNERYTENLFDNQWILLNFSNVLDEFSNKVDTWDKNSRLLEKEFQKELGKKEKEKEILELPIGTPSRKHMEEMLEVEHCKVCNRSAEKGSEPYKYMESRLQDYLDYLKQKKSPLVEPQFFKSQYIKGIDRFWNRIEQDASHTVNSISSEISENFQLLNRLKNDISDLVKNQREFEGEKLNIIGSQNISYDSAVETLQKYKHHSHELRQKERSLSILNHDLTSYSRKLHVLKRKKLELKDKLGAVGQEYEDKRILFDAFSEIFDTLQKEDLRELNNLIKEKTDIYYKKVNKGYAGKIFWHTDLEGKISKFELEGDPSQSQKTRLTLSVLVAIQDILKSNQDEEEHFEHYPMVMDAPISNFDAAHSEVFLKTISNLTDQSIILLKDYFDENGEVDMGSLNKVKAEGVHVLSLSNSKEDNKLHTIETIVKKII